MDLLGLETMRSSSGMQPKILSQRFSLYLERRMRSPSTKLIGALAQRSLSVQSFPFFGILTLRRTHHCAKAF